MKYQPNIYAKALADVVASAPKEGHGAVVSNFVALLEKNGDMKQADKVVRLAERIILKSSGRRMLSVESARPLKGARVALHGIVREGDVIEEKVNPSLFAGIKITVDGERQFDGSLKRKLEKMFQ